MSNDSKRKPINPTDDMEDDLQEKSTQPEQLANLPVPPNVRYEQKRDFVLPLIYRFGVTTPSIMSEILDTSDRSFPGKLQRRGLTLSHNIHLESVRKIILLTPLGVEVAQELTSTHTPYCTDPHRINPRILRHDLITQKLVLKLQNEGFDDYITEKEIKSKGKKGEKVPDAIVLSKNENVGIEVELTGKFDRRLDQFIKAIMDKIESLEYDKFIIFCSSNALLKRYEKAFKAGNDINNWQKNDNGQWKTDSTFTLPSLNVEFRLIDNHISKGVL